MIGSGRRQAEWIQQDSGGEEADRGGTKAGRKQNRQHKNTKTIPETDYHTSCQCYTPPTCLVILHIVTLLSLFMVSKGR